MIGQPFPPAPQNSNEPSPFKQPSGGSPRVNLGTENNSYVVNNDCGAPQPGVIPPLQPLAYASPAVELDCKGCFPATVRKRRTWAWVGLGIGVFVILGAIVDSGGAVEALRSLMIGGTMALPGAWWLRCERQDCQALAEWEERATRNQELKQEARRRVRRRCTRHGEGRRPKPADRKWPMIAIAAVALLIVGGAL
ncbi:hypothetical protein MHK13_11510 [Corynebacterium hadale]|uniref:hypothetical protein n=1 Tax=Corynebacterium hadale TaxID=2026255 RepID=UPI001EF28D0F|nr:hypothetical protein [Corynebacterium hadale]MCG7255338.1 hypothetical protein [Corynebacterium hadale]MCG7257668.1 hypothetical protein [Corynebacterium hadale]MCG7266367.1 hypothetical protein [Corynebacterium hadale]